MTKIVVTVSRKEMQEVNPIFINMGVIYKMRKAGVPVVGNTVVEGVEHGTLTVRPDGDEMVYTWEGTPVAKARPNATTTVAGGWEDDEDEL